MSKPKCQLVAGRSQPTIGRCQQAGRTTPRTSPPHLRTCLPPLDRVVSRSIRARTAWQPISRGTHLPNLFAQVAPAVATLRIESIESVESAGQRWPLIVHPAQAGVRSIGETVRNNTIGRCARPPSVHARTELALPYTEKHGAPWHPRLPYTRSLLAFSRSSSSRRAPPLLA